jgi:hypothetical protein
MPLISIQKGRDKSLWSKRVFAAIGTLLQPAGQNPDVPAVSNTLGRGKKVKHRSEKLPDAVSAVVKRPNAG